MATKKMPSKAERMKRIAKGVKADAAPFKGTRTYKYSKKVATKKSSKNRPRGVY